MSEHISVAEAAKIIGVNIDTMYSIVDLNNFKVLKIPRLKKTTYRINRASFEEWIKTHSV